MLTPVKPVTHCWCQGALLKGTGSCGGVSRIFREGGMSWWDREQRGHTRGTVPPQVPLGAAWTFLSQFHGKSPGSTCDCQGDTSSRDSPRKIWWASIEFLPLALSWSSSSPWSFGWQDQEDEWGLVSPQHLVPGFGDVQGCSGVIPILSQDAWPCCVTTMGLLAFLVEFCWSLECNYCSFVRGEVRDFHPLVLRVLCKFQYLSSLFELNEGASLMLSRILFLGLLSFFVFWGFGIWFFWNSCHQHTINVSDFVTALCSSPESLPLPRLE